MGPDRRPKSGHLLAVLIDVAYDPNQPRRSDGKWGSKGGRSSGSVTWDATDVDPALEATVKDTIDGIVKDVPALDGYLTGIKRDVGGAGGYSGDSAAQAVPDDWPTDSLLPKTWSISLNGPEWSSKDSMDRMLRDQVAMGQFLPGTDPAHLVTHEAAHVIDNWAQSVGDSRGHRDAPTTADALDAVMHDLEGMKADWPARYGKTDRMELFAEAYASDRRGVKTPAGDKVRRFVDGIQADKVVPKRELPPLTPELQKLMDDLQRKLNERGYDANGQLWAYSPTQPRRADGKFGTKGARGAGPAPASAGNGGPGVPDVTQAGFEGAKALTESQFADEWGYRTGSVPKEVAEATDSRLKREAMLKVGDDLEAQFPKERLQALADSLPASSGSVLVDEADHPGHLVADGIMASWAEVAYDPDARSSVALQLAVAKEFGTGVTPFIRDDIAKNKGARLVPPAPGEPPTVETWSRAYAEFDEPVMRAAVRSMYDHTQARLDELGVTAISVGRGVGAGSHFRGAKAISLNPASSWTTDMMVAERFTGPVSPEGTVMTMTVPKERVLSIPGNGIGCYSESEVVLLRGSGDRANGKEPM